MEVVRGQGESCSVLPFILTLVCSLTLRESISVFILQKETESHTALPSARLWGPSLSRGP